MENKKQLVIVPPMSQPMQKLHEVLNGIVEEENIEISLVDNSKEFGQFIGSSGQCLVVFSNPKLCVTFLQENRSSISKTHSKVILLTPKEIPAKTLVKFVKLGLTESILDGSPPKTLLYKVKLLLRSIKSTSSPQEDKNRVVKSSQDAVQAPTDQDDLPALKNESEEQNAATEEKSKKFTNDEENIIDYGGRLKGKNKYQEESIDTNWKSKRTTESLVLGSEESSNQKVKEEESDDIDMYYRGKKKSNISVVLEEAYSNEKKSSTPEEESVADYDLKKRSELDLELGAGETPEKRKAYQEEEYDPQFVKKKDDTIILLEEEEKPRERILTEEEKEETRKKELLELDALFEAARKKQAQEAEDLGGHYKGEIDNSSLNLEVDDDNDEDKPKKEYDNSELFEDEKKRDLVLDLATEDNRRSTQQEEDNNEIPPHEGEVDNIDDDDMMGEGGAGDRIDTLMITKTDKEASKKLVNEEELDLDLKKRHDSEEESDSLESDKKKSTLELLEGDSNNSHKKDMSEAEFELDLYKREELEIEASTEDFSRKSLESEDQDDDQDDQNQKATSLNLQLADGDDDRAKSTSQNEESDIEIKKLKNSELDLAGSDKKERSAGKVDDIDKYYRSGEAKKVEHSWDNLTSRSNSLDLNLEKATRGEDEEGSILPKKNLGEITIDYRKLKEEFDYIAKNGASGEEGSINERSARSINDSDDEGTFKVIELNARGFEFGIDMVNLIYQKDSKAPDFYKKVSEELISQYKGYPIFYTYKSSDKKHTEVFDSIIHFGDSLVSSELKEWWFNTKTQKDVFDNYFDKTMATWLCRKIQDKSGSGSFWEDVELPSWAANELTDKKVEMIFPYFDGVDRMGVAILIFPTGINPIKEKSIMVTLEMVRTILLESIQRKLSVVEDKSQNNEAPVAEKKNIMGMFSGLFNRNKAG